MGSTRTSFLFVLTILALFQTIFMIAVKIPIILLTNVVTYDIITRMVSKKGHAPTKRPKNDDELAQGNQWQATEKQVKYIDYYMDPKSETFGNSYQSAIKAGYTESYAANIMKPSVGLEWVKQAYNIMKLEPDHLKMSLAKIITDPYAKDSDKISAIKLLGQDQGLFVEKKLVGVVGIEQALSELE